MSGPPHQQNDTFNPQMLFAKAFESLDSKMQDRTKADRAELDNQLQELTFKVAALNEGMQKVKTNLEFMYKEQRESKKKVEMLNEKLKAKDEELQKMAEEMKQMKRGNASEMDENDDRDDSSTLTDETASDAKTMGSVPLSGEKNGDAKRFEQGDGGSDKNITFQKEVSGKNVMIGNEVAAVGEGTELKFSKPLSKDPNALTNYDEMINDDQPGSSNQVQMPEIDALKDSTFVGNAKVNVQQNLQNVYLSGHVPANIEVDDSSAEPNQYRKADQDELADFLERSRKDTERNGDEEPTPLGPDEELQKKDVILRVAKLVLSSKSVEQFVRLCELLMPLSPKQSLSLGPHLDHIMYIDLTGIQMNFYLLSAFIRCFTSKTFHYLSLSGSCVRANDVQLLASSLHTNKIDYLDLGNCTYEYMAFFNLASLFPRINRVSMRGLTSAMISPENALASPKIFSADNAQQLAESIARSTHTLGIDFTGCNFSDTYTLMALFNSFSKIHSLSLKNAYINRDGIQLLIQKMPDKMQKLDLSGVDLRNHGLELICGRLTIKTLLLSNVMIDDGCLNTLLEALSNLPDGGMEVLDLSFNALSTESISKLLSCVGKVKLIIFSANQLKTEQIDYVMGKKLEEDFLLSQVVGGRICSIEDLNPNGFTHWVATNKPVEDIMKKHVMEYAMVSPNEIVARTVPEYRCSKCHTHIAFKKDVIPAPCAYLYNDRKFFGVFNNAYFTTVSRASSCSPRDNAKAKKHLCKTSKCHLSGYKMRTCVCEKCMQPIGGLYSNKEGGQFWCLYQEAKDGLDVGGSMQLCRQQ